MRERENSRYEEVPVENQISKIKMQNDKEKIKKEFKKRLYDFTLRLIEFLDKLPDDNVSRRIGDQLLRSGTSIIGNYFNTSLKSANESKLWLALLRDSKRAKGGEVLWFLDELDEVANIFASSILTLRGKK